MTPMIGQVETQEEKGIAAHLTLITRAVVSTSEGSKLPLLSRGQSRHIKNVEVDFFATNHYIGRAGLHVFQVGDAIKLVLAP